MSILSRIASLFVEAETAVVKELHAAVVELTTDLESMKARIEAIEGHPMLSIPPLPAPPVAAPVTPVPPVSPVV